MIRFILVSFLALSILPAFSETVPGRICQGKDTLEVSIIIPRTLLYGYVNYPVMQKKVRYLSKEAGFTTSKLLRPEDADEIRFVLDGETIRMVSGKRKRKPIFLKLDVDGTMRVFEYYRQASHEDLIGELDIVHVVQKGRDQPFYSLSSLNPVNERLRWIFGDCPNFIATHLEDRDVYHDAVPHLVREFNKGCD